MKKSRVALIVEDDEGIAHLQAVLLRDTHEVTLITHDFSRAMDDALWKKASVGVFDLMLGGEVGGDEIALWVGTRHPHVRRVICTAVPVSELADVAEMADYVLSKPFTPKQFLEAVGV